MIPWPVGPPACTTTSHTSVAGVAGVGSTKVHVAPESVLIATPQFVPANTSLGASGRIAMPNADGSFFRAASQLYGASGVALAGRDQGWPASVLTLMPAFVATRPS